jgi:hypothetical protein
MNFLNLLEMSNMDLILHIGHYKTGTTSIQFFLHKHREILLEKYKLLYPLSGIPGNKEIFGQVLLAPHYSKSSGCDFDEVVNLLINEIVSLKPIKVCISSEELCAHNATVHLLERINYLFKKIIILFYIIRQDIFVEKSYKERLKNNKSKITKNFQESIKDVIFLLEYDKIINNIKNFSPSKIQIIPRIYDRALFPEGNVILDFLSVLGIDETEAMKYKIEMNSSLSHISALALRKINEQFNLRNEERLKVIHYLLKLDREEGSGPLKTFFTLDERIEFLERFRESNERLFRECFNSENKFVLTQEEIEFYKEQDRIPKEEIERLVEERYQKVVENVIKKIEAKPKVYIPVKIEKLAKEVEIVEKVLVDQLYIDLLKDSKLVIGGVVVLKADVNGEYRLLVEDGEGIKEVKWGIPSPGYAKMYPDNPYAKNVRFKGEGLVIPEDRPIRLYLEDGNKNKILIYEIRIPFKMEV